uniref:Uncharacterized protein n=1 Tax=Anguilla anguilla TaxID=7936 RepID=A0A0E9WA12_ANGAN
MLRKNELYETLSVSTFLSSLPIIFNVSIEKF